MQHTHIVKRRGHKEPYDNHKVFNSCWRASLNAHLSHNDAKKICETVTTEIDQWIDDKKEISSQDIFQKIGLAMKKLSKDAAFMYETHRDIS